MAELKPFVIEIKYGCTKGHDHETLGEALKCNSSRLPIPTLDVVNFHVSQLPEVHQKIYRAAYDFDLELSDYASPEWQLNSRILDCFSDYAKHQEQVKPMRAFNEDVTQ